MQKVIDTQKFFLGLEVTPDTLTPKEIEFLDRNGYLVLHNILNQEQIATFGQRLNELTQLEGYSAGAVDQTSYQLKVNRKDLSMGAKIAAIGYNLIFYCIKTIAINWLFKYNPSLKPRLRARSSSPEFGSPQLKNSRRQQARNIFDWIKIEVREMLAAAAFTEAGAKRICNLINKDSMFDVCFQHPKVLAAVRHIIGSQIKVSSINYRAAKPNGGLQPLHSDWEEAVTPGNYLACNTLWTLDDFTEHNGATRVVAGSHLYNQIPQEAVNNCLVAHPEQELILAPAGSVIIMNSHTWHGGTVNTTDNLRRIIQSYFVCRNQAPQLNQRKYIRESTLARLTPEEKVLLDVD